MHSGKGKKAPFHDGLSLRSHQQTSCHSRIRNGTPIRTNRPKIEHKKMSVAATGIASTAATATLKTNHGGQSFLKKIYFVRAKKMQVKVKENKCKTRQRMNWLLESDGVLCQTYQRPLLNDCLQDTERRQSIMIKTLIRSPVLLDHPDVNL